VKDGSFLEKIGLADSTKEKRAAACIEDYLKVLSLIAAPAQYAIVIK
jgi:hypothetical protein